MGIDNRFYSAGALISRIDQVPLAEWDIDIRVNAVHEARRVSGGVPGRGEGVGESMPL